MSEPQEFLEGVPQGEGHFVKRTTDGYTVEAFFVNLGQARGGKRVVRPTTSGREPSHVLERDDLLLILDAKKRDWRKSRASASERERILLIGSQLVRSGLTASSVARNLGLSPRTYRKWKSEAGIS
jgi:hypothetical protein